MSKTMRPKRGRAVFALIPLDTEKIRKNFQRKYDRKQKKIRELKEILRNFEEDDLPGYRQFIARSFGAEQTRQRELEEKINLLEIRIEKLEFMADRQGITVAKYAAKIRKQVTPELDFWEILEREIDAFQKQESELDDEIHFDPESDESDESFDDTENFWDDFSRFFSDPDDAPVSENPDETRELKKIYRELCLKYHPDKNGVHDEKTKMLWIAIQQAYQERNLRKLRNLQAGLRAGEGKQILSCSDLLSMSAELEAGIRELRREILSGKKNACWGFSAWSAVKINQTRRLLKKMYEESIRDRSFHLSMLEQRMEEIRKPRRSSGRRRHDEMSAGEMAFLADLFRDWNGD